MTPKRLEECLQGIRWAPATLAASLRVEDAVVGRWLDGTEAIPTNVGSWLEALCFTHEASDLMRPVLPDRQRRPSEQDLPRHEHVPVYSYNLLRRLGAGPVPLRTLFGTDDEGAVFFLVSRGLAERDGASLIITAAGRRIGEVAEPQKTDRPD